MKVGGISIVVKDLETSVKYYTEVLGFGFFDRFTIGVGKSAMLTAGGVLVHLIESDKMPLGIMDFSMRTDDIEKDIAEMVEKGAIVVREPSTVKIGKLAQLKDPDGNNIMLVEWNKELKEQETTVTEIL